MRVSLIGGGGFIGVNLARRLQADPRFAPVVHDVEDRKLSLAFANSVRCPYEYCDIRGDETALDAAVRNSDVVVNLVAYVRPKNFLDVPLDVVNLNFIKCLDVIKACVRHNKRLIHFSTSEVYGKTGGRDDPFSEDETDLILGPINHHRWIYSASKQLLDRTIHAFGLNGHLEYTIVRPFNFVGPMMDWIGGDEIARVFPSFMTALLERRPIPLVDGGYSRRCFTAIDDAVDALVLILSRPEGAHNEIFNIGNPGNEVSVAGLADLMTEIYGELTGVHDNPPPVPVASEEFYGPGYEDCDRRLPDISKLQRLGWTPRIDLYETFHTSMSYTIANEGPLRDLAPDRIAARVAS